mgnify:CR=1 FL=1
MKSSILAKLELLKERYEEVGALLSDSEIISDQDKFRPLSKEYAELEPVVLTYSLFAQIKVDIEEASNLLKDSDPDMREMAEEELKRAELESENLELELQHLLLPKDPNDGKNVFLEIRAGTGGDEAAIFSGDLFRMYSKFAENNSWKLEIISQSLGDHGGYKEIISRISGNNIFSRLKFESGAHRVQRVPLTESQGRVHTSACTVAVLPEAQEIEEVTINPSDLRVDTYRASGAGGQHVNKTDSAVRLTHIPSGVVVECQDERSQHKNKARAMSLLQAKLLDAELSLQANEQAQERKLQVGSGDRSERIRTYNFPQGRVTDHRINLTLHKLEEFLEGEAFDEMIETLPLQAQEEKLSNLT